MVNRARRIGKGNNRLAGGAIAVYDFSECRNLLKYSQQFDNAAWVIGANVTITPNAAIAPDGTMTADKMVTSGADDVSANQLAQAVTTTIGNPYCDSIWIRADTPISVKLKINSSTEVIGTKLCNITSEWQRFFLSGVAVAVGTYITIRPNGVNAITDGIYIWAGQINYGLYPTQYYPTTDKQLLKDTSRVSKNLLLPNQANCGEDGTTTGLLLSGATTISVDTTEHYSGTSSIKCVTAGSGSSEGVSTNGYKTKVTPSSTFSASAKVKGTAVNLRVLLYEYKDDGTQIGVTIGTMTNPGGDWVKITVTRTFSELGSYAMVLVGTASSTATTFYVDDLQLEVGSAATDWEAPPNTGLLGGSLTVNTNTPTWTDKGLYFTTDDYVSLPAVLAGKNAATVMIVANVTSSVPYAGVLSAVSTAASNFALSITDYIGSNDQVQAYQSDGSATSAAILTGKLTATYEALICRFNGGVELSIQHGFGAKAVDTTSVPASFNANTTKLILLGRSGSNYLTGNISYLAIWDRALSDAEVAQCYNYIKSLMAQRGVALA